MPKAKQYKTIAPEQLRILGSVVWMAAFYLFDECGAAEDLCIQHATSERVIFGGTNRVIWKPATGFYMDESYCTPRFRERFPATLEKLRDYL